MLQADKTGMSNQDRYRIFSEQHDLPPCFQPWWLDAVCGEERWDAAIADGPEARVRAVWPWYRTRRLGLPVVLSPPFTSYGGPWLVAGNSGSSSKYTAEYKIYTQLIAQLPKVLFFRQNLHPDRRNWLPLYWAGFRETVRYTYRLHPDTILDRLWMGFFPSLRSHLRKAEKMVYIGRDDTALDILWMLNAASWGRQGLRQPHSIHTLRKLHQALQQRGHSALWLAHCTGSQKPIAALYLVYDNHSAGVVITGAGEKGRATAALSALYCEAIRFAFEKGLVFDFEGSMHPGIERAFRAFNAHLTPYHQIYKWGPG